GFNETLASIGGLGTITSSAAAATLTVNNVADITFSGSLSGTLGLTKGGAGVLTLTANNTYTGTTTITASTLLVMGSQPGSPVSVNSGATLGGTGRAGNVTVNNGGTLSPGTSPGVLSTGNVIFGPGATFLVEVNGTTAGSLFDVLNVNGTVTLQGPPNPNLVLNLGFGPATGTSIAILANDGTADPIAGPPAVTFNGVPANGIITSSGARPGRLFRINYGGG